MIEGARRGLDAVDLGPLPSDSVRSGADGEAGGAASDHPSIVAMAARFPGTVRRSRVASGTQHVVWIDPSRSLEIFQWLNADPDQVYDMLSDVTGIDYGGGRPVEVVYQLFSTLHRRALRVRCELPLDHLEIDSVWGIWKAANWLEREVYDLFGVVFRGHPDLRRILMPYDYAEGNPLRKDFPLRGRFSRAEQTRRALAQNVDRFYTTEQLGAGEAQELGPEGQPRSAGEER